MVGQVIHPQQVLLRVILEVEHGIEVFMELLVAVVELVDIMVVADKMVQIILELELEEVQV